MRHGSDSDSDNVMGGGFDSQVEPPRPARRAVLAGALLAAVAAMGACPSAATRDTIASEVAAATRDHGPRVAVATWAAQVDAALAAGRAELAGEQLAAIWPLRTQLADDRVLRGFLRALPDAAVPASLAPDRAVEAAQTALEDGRPEVARILIARSPAPPDPAARTALRADITAALAGLGDDAAEARARLSRVANRSYGDPVARELGALALLTLAGSYLDDGAYKEAIAGFLRVGRASGYWRQARYGLASCQLQAGRPESALKVLALLPGGLAADPERALLAAVAAHAMALPADAVAIVDAALERRALWQDAPDTAIAVGLEAARLDAGGGDPEDDTLVTVIAAVPAVRAALAELAATRSARARGGPDALPLADWERRMAHEAEAVVARELAAATKRAVARCEDLATLRPQLR